MKPKIFYLLFLFISICSFAQTVNIEGDPYNGNPYTDINAAITAANDGDVILISGIHTETLTFGKSITLRGTDPTLDIVQAAASPLSDGSGTNVLNIIANQLDNANVTIENLGIRNGNEGTSNGGGINVDKVTGLITLKNLIIENNHTSQLGGGLSITGSNADIIDCTISGNNADQAGGGIIVAPNNGSAEDSVINIIGSLINNNEGLNGGGIYINGNPGFGDDYRIDVNIENSTVSNNNADSGSGAVGGGAIWSKASIWTTNDGGDGVSTNVTLQIIHSTFFNNSHAANIKSGIQGTGTSNTDFSAFNSIIVHDGTTKRAINFANLNTTEVKNCILGGLNAAPGAFLDAAARNNVRGKTATFAGLKDGALLTGTLSDEGGNTQVLPIANGSNANNYCTATVTAVSLPTVDQRSYDRVGIPDAGAFEFGGTLPQPCEPPTGIANINVATTAASFSWNAEPSADDGFEWAVVTSSGDPDVTADVVVQGTTNLGVNRVSATGLSNNTSYDFYVRSDCGSEFSDWSTAVNFTTSFAGNLILNSRFTDGLGDQSIADWEGYGTGSKVDDLKGEYIGFINLSDGAFRQDFNVVPGVTYSISYEYRWITTPGSINPNDLTPVIRDPNISGVAGVLESLPATQTTNDVWYSQNYLYTHPINSDLDVVRLQFFKGNNINEFGLYNPTVLENRDISGEGDYTYKNEAWSPSNPAGVATATDDIYIFNGRVEISSDLTANNIEVTNWADVDVSAVLDLAGTLTTNGNVDFKNDATSLGQLKSGSVTGSVIVERYIPGGNRAFRLVTSAVDSDSSIYNNWQERGFAPSNLGTHITGSDTGANGFDQTSTGSVSMFTFDNSVVNQAGGSAWTPISNTDVNTLNAGELYRVYVRGDRSIDLTNNDAVANETVLRAKGTLKTGTLTTGTGNIPALSATAGNYSAVANPYQAIIDAEELTYNDVNANFIYVWDANELANGKFVVVSTDGSVAPNPSSSSANQYIMPGQAFFVQNSSSISATPNIVFEETNKATSQAQVEIFSEEPVLPYLNLRLYTADALSNNLVEADAIGFRFAEEFTNSPSDEDASKLGNPDENLAIINNQSLFYIENRSMPVNEEVLPLFVNGYTDLDYSFKAIMGDIPENIQVYLDDNYTGESYLIENNGVFNFSVDESISESTAYDRFQIRFNVVSLSNVDFDNKFNFNIYPNPVADVLKIDSDLNEDIQSVEVYNQLGKLILSNDQLENLHLDVSQLQTGMYLIKLYTQKTSFTTKFIKK